MSDRKKDILKILEKSKSHDDHVYHNHDKKHSYMAKPQLKQIAEQAAELDERIKDGEPLDDWAESHIAQCNSMINSVYRSIFFKEE